MYYESTYIRSIYVYIHIIQCTEYEIYVSYLYFFVFDVYLNKISNIISNGKHNGKTDSVHFSAVYQTFFVSPRAVQSNKIQHVYIIISAACKSNG